VASPSDAALQQRGLPDRDKFPRLVPSQVGTCEGRWVSCLHAPGHVVLDCEAGAVVGEPGEAIAALRVLLDQEADRLPGGGSKHSAIQSQPVAEQQRRKRTLIRFIQNPRGQLPKVVLAEC
jgi:hypothetical protein